MFASLHAILDDLNRGCLGLVLFLMVWIGAQYANMEVLIRLWIREEANLRLSAGRGTGSLGLGAPAGEFEQNYYC